VARVPTYEPQVQEIGLPSGTQSSVASPSLFVGATNAQNLDNLARGLDRTGGLLNDLAIQEQQKANQLRVDDAINKLKEQQLTLTFDQQKGFLSQKGVQALERPSGQSLDAEYRQQFDAAAADIAGQLGNDAQRRMFNEHAAGLGTQFHSQVMQHQMQEFNNYALSVRDGTISNRTNEIGLYYNDPKHIDEAVTSIQAATADKGRMLGWSAEQIEAQSRTLTSNAHLTALNAALEHNDIRYADAYLKKYAGQMDANDLLRAQGLITKEMDNQVALGVASDVMSKAAPKMVQNDADRAFNIALNTESGSKQFNRDGSVVTSPKGATGIAQVMPGTGPEAAKLAGVPWDEKRFRSDPEYNAALGKAYFTKQLQTFGGNLAMAYAAYNAGPGAMQSALNASKKDGKPWVDHLPAETQNYVAKNMAAYQSGGGQTARPTLEDLHAEVRSQVGTDNPRRLKLALDEVSRQYEDQTKALKARDEESTTSAMRALIQNGGNFTSLPPSVRNAIPPDKYDNVMDFATKLAKGVPVETNMAVYQKLETDEKYLKGLSDNAFFQLKGQLSDADFKHFADKRGALLNKPGSGSGPESLDDAAIKRTLDNRLATLGIDPSVDVSKDQKAAGRVGAIRQFVNQAIIGAQQASGKKLTDAEVEKYIDGLFAKNLTFRQTHLFGADTTEQQRMLTMGVDDIPVDSRKRLEADFKVNGNPNPTAAELLSAYWQLKNAQGAAR